MKTCKKCGEQKETTEYYNQKRYKDKLDPMCKDCRKKTNKEYHDANKESILEKVNKWRSENLERTKETSRIYYQTHKEQYRSYYKKKRENETRD
jgi:hypothetical protein